MKEELTGYTPAITEHLNKVLPPDVGVVLTIFRVDRGGAEIRDMHIVTNIATMADMAAVLRFAADRADNAKSEEIEEVSRLN